MFSVIEALAQGVESMSAHAKSKARTIDFIMGGARRRDHLVVA
jgi:hypothetical protein